VKWFFPRGWERTSALSSKFVSKYLTSPPNKASRSRTPTLACMFLVKGKKRKRLKDA
jgi:hypothetical protein